MAAPKFSCILITAANPRQAHKIAQALVRDRLAACVNIVPKVQSIYRWKGKIERGQESLLIAKTRNSKVRALVAEVKKLHSYAVPETVALPIVEGNRDYLNWIRESV